MTVTRDEDRLRFPIKKAGFGITIAAAAILWLLFQIYIWNNQLQYLTISEKVCRSLGINSNTEWMRGCSVMAYLTTLPPVLFGYFFTVQRPRLFPSEKYWNRKRMLIASVVVVCSVVLSLFSVPRIYRELIPRSGVHNSPQSWMFDAVFYTNIFVGLFGLLLVLAMALIPSVVRRRRQIFSGKSIAKSTARYGICLVAAVLTIVISGLVLNILQSFNKDAAQFVSKTFALDSRLITGIVAVVVMAPLVEELAFRGLIFGKLRNYVPLWTAFLFSAVCFGIWHRNLGQFSYTLFMGLFFTAVYYQTGRLRYAMLVHGAGNLLSTLAFGPNGRYLPHIPVLGKIQKDIMALPMPLSIVLLIVMTAAIVLLLWKVLPLAADKEQECF